MLVGILRSAGKVDWLTHFPEMDLPATISLPTNKVDIALSVEEASIATRHPTSLPSVLEYSENLGVAPNTPLTISGGHVSLSCDIHTAPEMKPQKLKSREYMQFITLCWFIYLEGWNDGTNGPLLPRMQRVYGVHLFQLVGGCY